MHNCPLCDQACYCQGDVDDCPVDPSAEDRCTHCDAETAELDDPLDEEWED